MDNFVDILVSVAFLWRTKQSDKAPGQIFIYLNLLVIQQVVLVAGVFEVAFLLIFYSKRQSFVLCISCPWPPCQGLCKTLFWC